MKPLPAQTDCHRVAIIGAGHVGSTTAFALMLRALVREIVLIDDDMARAHAEASDISDAGALARPTRIWAGGYADAAGARLAIVTAGAATHGSDSRMSVTALSATVVHDCVNQLMAAGFDGILIVASNPVDVMTRLAQIQSGLAARHVIGTGTLLDTLRLKQALGAQIHVASGAIDALVIGEHGDSEVVASSLIRVGGLPLDRFASGAADDLGKISDRVRAAGYQIIQGKGHTSFGVATAIVRICEAILRNERTILPVSTMLSGEFGISDVCLSLPCLLGEGGIERILLPELACDEVRRLRASAEAIRTAQDALA